MSQRGKAGRKAGSWRARWAALDAWWTRGPSLTTERSTTGVWVLLLAAMTGLIVGGLVVLADRVALEWLPEFMAEQPLWFQAAGPTIGLVVAVVVLRFLTGTTDPSTTDDYITDIHYPGAPRTSRSAALGRALGGVGTVGYGGALGLDGPALLAGGVIGTVVQRRFARFFTRQDTKLLMMAGAAAGLAALFRTPAAGAIFAVEVFAPSGLLGRAKSRRGVGNIALILPIFVGSAAGYAVSAGVNGTEPLLSVATLGNHFDRVDLAGAFAVGVVCGLIARLVSLGLAELRLRVEPTPLAVRMALCAPLLFGLAYLSSTLADEPFSLGAGYDVITWVTDPMHSLWVVLAILLVRLVAAGGTLAGGGVGGLFVPLLVAGALTGRLVGDIPQFDNSALLIVVGMAALAGAGYRAPITAVVFVAEATGQPAVLIPAIVATVAAQLLMGPFAVTSSPRVGRRLDPLDRRNQLPVTAVLETDVLAVPADTTVAELMDGHVLARRERTVPVVDGEHYVGLATAEKVAGVRRPRWPTTQLRAVTSTDKPAGRVTWLVRDAVDEMERTDTDLLAIVDSHDRFVGVVTTDSVLRLAEIDELLEEAAPEIAPIEEPSGASSAAEEVVEVPELQTASRSRAPVSEEG